MQTTRPGQTRQRVPRAKVVVPGVPPGYVTRPRLLEVLDQARDATAVVVSAPAGSGKTLLLAEWVRLRRSGATAWVSLDADDNDDRRFWSGILRALEECPRVPANNPVHQLTVPADPSRQPEFTGAVVNAVNELPDPVWLVLDDLHEISADAPMEGLETLLRHQLPGLRLVLSTRHDPPLALARLRLADQLAEIGATDLRFSSPEAHALLGAAGVELAPGQLDELVQRTEGWAAVLRLATVSLRDTDDRVRFLAEFAENDRAVADYLLGEVLSRLSPELVEFLRAVSVSDEVSTSLAHTLSGRVDAGVILDTLERSTSLVTRIPGRPRWYRMQALVRSYLLADLNRQLPGRAAVLHRHAADWFGEHDRPVQALAQLIQTRDTDHVGDALRRLALPLALSGEHELLGRALAMLGEELIAADTLLALVSALLHLEEGQVVGAEVDLAHAEAAWRDPVPADVRQLHRLVKARLAELGGDVDDMLKGTADVGTDGARQPLDAMAMLQRGTALLLAGRHGAAREQLAAALDAARADQQDYVVMQCLTRLSGIAGTDGDFRLMEQLAAEAARQAEATGTQHTMAAASAATLLAYGELLRGHPAECLRQAELAARLDESGVPPVNRSLYAVLGTLAGIARFELGEWAEGLTQLGAARASVRGIHLSTEQVVISAMLEHRAATRFGWTDAGREAVRWIQAAAPGCGELLLMRARTQLALGRPGSAGRLLRPLLDAPDSLVLPWTVIDAWLLEAEVALFAEDEAEAQRAVRKALSLAEPMDVVYPLVVAAPAVTELLVGLLGKLGSLHGIAAHVLEVRRAAQIPVIAIPLTRRERTVLSLLPTLRSFDEIAQDLTISPNTVKTHVRSIYHKLGVRKRRDAVAVALQRGLLEAGSEVTNGPGLG